MNQTKNFFGETTNVFGQATKSATSWIPASNTDVYLDPCLSKRWVNIFNAILVLLILLVALYGYYEFNEIKGDTDPEVRREKMRMLAATISMIGIILWPLIWDNLIGYAVVIHRPITMFGFLWPMILCTIELIYTSTSKGGTETASIFGLKSITSDTNTIIGIAFAIGSLLSSQGNSALAASTTPLIMYALFLLIAFIIPTPNLTADSYTGFATAIIQRIFLNYAMGFVITGISLNVSRHGGSGIQKTIRTLCEQQSSKPLGVSSSFTNKSQYY